MGRRSPIRTRKGAAGRTLSIVALLAVLLAAGCTVARWPVQGPLTSPYGIRFRGLRPEIHEGVDIRVPVGTRVTAMMGGTVVHAGALGDFGLAIILQHGGSTRSVYAHLSAVDVAAGQRVEGGQVIGRSGQSGNATGPHLHFEIRRRGRTEDPVPLLGGRPGETVPSPEP